MPPRIKSKYADFLESGPGERRIRVKRDGYDIEDTFQAEAATFLDVMLLEGSWWCHIPNGGKRPLKTAIRLKKMGTKAGAPDNLIIHRGRAYWIELKGRYGTLKPSQERCIPLIQEAGAPVGIARTLDDIYRHLTAWGIPLRMTMEEYRGQPRSPPPGSARTSTSISASAYRSLMGLDAPKKR